jgi:hypothetical protein
MANLGILEKERKLRKDLIELEKQLQAAEAKGDKAREIALEKQKSGKERELELHKLNTAEAKESLNIGKRIVSDSRKWNNTLKGTSGIVMGVQNLMADIDVLGSKNDRRSKKLLKHYTGWVNLTDDVLRNFELMGTSEFVSLNVNSEILKAQRLISSEKDADRKADLEIHLETLRHLKDQQDLYKSIHDTAGEAAKVLMGPLTAVQNALGQVPVVGGLFAKMFDLEGIQENLTKKIADSMKGGFDTAEPTVYFDNISKRWKDVNTNAFVSTKHGEEQDKIHKGHVKSMKTQAMLGKARIAVLGVALALWAKIGKYAMDTGLSFQQIATLGPQLIINSQAVEAFADEFGTVGELSTGLAIDLKKQRSLYGAQEKDVAKLLKLQQGMTGATKEQIVSDLPGMYKDARKAGVSPAKLMENMAGSSEFLAKYVGGSVKEMGAFAIEAAKSGVSLQSIEQSMKGALDWESSITKEMEASVLLGKQISLDKFRELSFNEDGVGALAEQQRILRSLGPLDQLRLDQKEALAGVFSMEFSQIVAMQREQDILNEATSKQADFWTKAQGSLLTYGASFMGVMPTILGMGSQLAMIFGPKGVGGAIKALGGHLATAGKAMGRFALKALVGAGNLLIGAVMGIWKAFAMIPFGLGIPLAIGAVAALYASYSKAKSKAPGKASGGPVKGMNPYMVGEKGPELFIPTMGGNIIPNDKLAGGTADRVYGDTSKQDAKFDTMIGLLQQANTDRNDGNRKGLMGIEGLRGM